MHPVYNDGVFLISGIGRPTPRNISIALFEGESGLPSLNNKTAFFVFFGKLIDSAQIGCAADVVLQLNCIIL